MGRGRAAAVGLWVAAGLGACDRGPCPEDMVALPGGRVQRGFPMPRHPWMNAPVDVVLDDYCIDRYEFPNTAGAAPRVEVSWTEARDACAAAGKRLCTAAEWERACKGPEGWRQSYGPARDPTACNTPLPGSGPGTAAAPLAPSGSHPRCVSPEGVYDLNGNVSEWTADAWDGPPEPFRPGATVDASWHTVRGGTMWRQTFYGQDCTSRHGHPASARFQDDGFRCCRDAR